MFEFSDETGLLLMCDGNIGIPFPTKQGNRPSSQDEGPFPCFVNKGIIAFQKHLKWRLSQLEPREKLQELSDIPKDPDVPIQSRYK